MERLAVRFTDDVVRLAFCEAATSRWRMPAMRHVGRVGADRTCCGLPVTVWLPEHPTDTISQVECGRCRAWMNLHTI